MSNPAETAVLTVNGQAYSGWTSVMVRRVFGGSIGSEFEFSVAQPLDQPADFAAWKIQVGDQVTVRLAGVLACTGYVFVRHPSFNANVRGVMISGRSKTADAVDTAAQVSGGQYRGYTLQALATALTATAGVSVVMKGSSAAAQSAFPQFSIQFGETVFEAVERLARQRGVHITDDANGNLVLQVFDPKAASAGQLIEGKNLVEAYAVVDGSLAFNAITIAAQRPGSDQVSGDACRDNSATVTNPNVRATRQYLGIMEEPGTSSDCAIRANMEMAYNGFELIDVHCVVQGWQSAPGVLWGVGNNYSVKSPMLDLDRVLAARQVTWSHTAEGTRTAIDLCTSESLAFAAGAVITPTGEPGDPSYSSDMPAQGARANQPDN